MSVLPRTYGLFRSKLLPQSSNHSESADLLCKSILPHVWAGSKFQNLIVQARTAFVTFHRYSLFHIYKLRISWQPYQFNGSNRAISLLGDNDLCNIFLFCVFMIVIIPVQKHYHIGILFNGSGLSKIRKHGPCDRDAAPLHRLSCDSAITGTFSSRARALQRIGKYRRSPAVWNRLLVRFRSSAADSRS